jgi:hypothetical protein
VRSLLRPWVIAALIGWSAIVFLAQLFKGGSIGGPACYTDPSCGENMLVPPLAWLGGIAVILLLGWATRRRAT